MIQTGDTYTPTLTVDERAEKTSHSIRLFTCEKAQCLCLLLDLEALTLLGNRRSQLCDQEMQRISLPSLCLLQSCF